MKLGLLTVAALAVLLSSGVTVPAGPTTADVSGGTALAEPGQLQLPDLGSSGSTATPAAATPSFGGDKAVGAGIAAGTSQGLPGEDKNVLSTGNGLKP
jgi:hypothetical protein